jgi:hypothetical protein
MMRRASSSTLRIRSMIAAALLATTAGLGACGGFDGVELQGGVFDALGVSGSGQKSLSEVKVEPRPSLVLPPSAEKLPAPGTGDIATGTVQGEAWPVDPEDRRAGNRAELEKRHKAYCERELQNARMRGDSGVVMGPMGNCQPGLFGSLTKQF